ncbi:MAG TPA: LuxR C-terminal-related transcriptional regulator [Terriglobales bacterium]|nr:LuxR C-terminal-related transcriptional regulator [Terriglobales bacterium]
MLESELFALLEGTTDAAFSVTEEGEILSWNNGAEKLFGHTRAAAVHKTCYEILEGMGPLGTRVCHEHCSVAECAGGNTEIPNFDMSVKTRSGKRVWINMSTIVFNNQRTGRRLLIHLAHDITEQKKGEKLTHKMLELSKQLSSLDESPAHPSPVPPLSEQEINILRMFAEGKEGDEVTRVLGISPQTLRNHLHHINQKLRTHNRLEAVMNAIQRKLI